MKKKKSTGLTLTSLISIIFFGYSFLFFIFFFPTKGVPFYIIYRYICYLLIGFSGLIASIFVLDLRGWARKLIILSCALFLGVSLFTDMIHFIAYKVYIFSIKMSFLYLFWAIILIFLTRPNVKKQFE